VATGGLGGGAVTQRGRADSRPLRSPNHSEPEVGVSADIRVLANDRHSPGICRPPGML
jgi:hypothetical protein